MPRISSLDVEHSAAGIRAGPSCASHTVPQAFDRPMDDGMPPVFQEHEVLKVRQPIVAHPNMSRSSETSVVSLAPPPNLAVPPSSGSERVARAASEAGDCPQVVELTFENLKRWSAECASESCSSTTVSDSSYSHARRGKQIREEWGSWTFFPE